jgi:Zn-dependent M28 family amino/carboxypeptidase
MKAFFIIIPILFAISCQSTKLPANKADKERIKVDLTKITKTGNYRNYLNLEALNNSAAYIFSEFEKVCDTVYYQEYSVDGNIYKNVVASIGTRKKERIVIGAHYDVCGEQQGADDNASGLVGLLELARLLSKEKLEYQVDFVAFTLEEPPFFDTKNMGSYVHAKSLHDKKVNVKGMICLEMIGYYNDEPNSQKYPIGILRWFYGNKGDFITVVQNFSNGHFGDKVKKLMTKQDLLPTKSFRGTSMLPGIDFSDHRNYWEFGYNAVMISNTAFYRNNNYHEPSDTMETLDFNRMCKVIDEICNCVLNL